MPAESWLQARKLTLFTLALGPVILWLDVAIVVLNEFMTAPTLAESALQQDGSVILTIPVYLTAYLTALVPIDYVAYHTIRRKSGAAEWAARGSYVIPLSTVMALPTGPPRGAFAALAALIVIFPVLHATEGTWDRWLNERLSERTQGA